MDIYQDRIFSMFQKSGMSNQQLEQEIGLPRGILYDWKMGRTKSYKKYSGQIASYFHVSTDYLLGNTDDPTPAGQKERPPAGGGEPIDPVTQELIEFANTASPEKRRAALEIIRLINKQGEA